MSEPFPILLVEDDEVDQEVVRRAFEKNNVTNPLEICPNGELALERLRSKGGLLPRLILLDLNMPVMGGLELLELIKADATLRTIPVVVLTSSDEQRDKLASYELGVAGYIVKPVDFAKFIEATRVLNLYWSLCEVPPPER